MLLIFRVWFFNPKFSMVNPKLVAVCYHGVNSCFILFYHQDLSEFAQVNSPCSSHLGAGLCWAGTPAKPRAMKREMLWTRSTSLGPGAWSNAAFLGVCFMLRTGNHH